ncbi:MAG TPA: alpha/beta fold hydrolase [Conexibacter sp.]|nr:alpha/beta fold hydrolase [Conexibacter sp.]
MRTRLLIPVALVCGVACVATTASAAPLADCSNTPQDRTLCGHVTVPLDRGGALPGTIALRVKALVPPHGGATSGTVLALAGGPGQAAVPLLDGFASALRGVLRTRELVVFDQRGTGGSGRLRCPALAASGQASLSSAIGRCAAELGARRTTFTTAASVEDVEAVRVALGVDRMVLYAASYGTKVALGYAAAYPQHVDRLILDSVVLPEGIDPFQRSTLASIPRVLRAACAGTCRFTRDAGADVASLARRLGRSALRGRMRDGHGHPHSARVSEADQLGLLLDGDFDRYLRAALPAAVRGALAGDPAPLVRLATRAGGAGSLADGSDSDAVYVATTCEDGQVPWATGTPLAARRAAVNAAADAIPATALLPFDRETVRVLGTADLCRAWPESPIAQPQPPMPTTPTLILSGDDDLRTPRADAVALAGRLPGARLLEVPDAGHGALFSDPTDCTEKAVQAFVRGSAPGACRFHANAVPPVRLAPRRLTDVPRMQGVPGIAGHTVTAVLVTLDDASEQVIEQVLGNGQVTAIGGLRAGSAVLERGGAVRLRGYGYVPGMVVSGVLPARGSRFALVVGGRATPHGRLTVSRRGVIGMLGGQRIDVPARVLRRRFASGELASAVASAASERSALRASASGLRPADAR